MTSNHDDRVLQWPSSSKGLAFSEPISLRPFAGESVTFDVAEDQAAVVYLQGEISATLLGGRHLIHVLQSEEERGDVSRPELAQRLRVEESDLDELVPRVRHIDAQAQVQFVALRSMPAMDWGREAPTPFHDEEDGPIDLNVEGAFRLRANDPVRFYRSFLRNTEDLPPRDFERIAGALVHGSTVRALSHVATSLSELPRDHRELAEALNPFVRQALDVVGLMLEEFEITCLELPVGQVTVEVEPVVENQRV